MFAVSAILPNIRKCKYVIGENDPHATRTRGVLLSSAQTDTCYRAHVPAEE